MKLTFIYIFFFVFQLSSWAAPIDTLLIPSRGSVQVPTNTRLQIYFNQPIQKGVGNISVYDGSSNNLIFSIPVSCTCVEVINNKVNITLPSMLSANQVVFVKILSGVFKSLTNEPFIGFTSNNEWRFTTASGIITNQSFSPANNSSCISIRQGTFQFNVSGNVSPNYNTGGKIYIYNKSTNMLHDSIRITSNQVVANNTSTITFTTYKPFTPTTEYYILIDPVSLISTAGSVYEGIYDSNVWTFKTAEGKALANNVEKCGTGNITLKASYNREGIQYRWYKTITGDPIKNESGQPISSSEFTTNIDFSTTYYVSVFYNGCLSYEKTPINVTVKPIPNSTLPLQEMRVGRGTYVQLEANGGDIYSWLPTEGLSNPNIANPVAYVERDTVYTVTITNNVGCSIQKSVRLIIDNGEKDLFIPTVFSPNDDGVHDFLRIRGKNITEIDWSVYDSQGKLVYRVQNISDAINIGWDGTFQGKPLKSDVYVWTLTGRFSDGSPFSQKAGSVLLIR
ncbi:MAG: gliding motility-associated C-terminal domain-containing protein [Raineya sp.]|jgi:gliding motility-associated-like protein|nr:gliding motility-associated C-terminal domain-containing protein [Raineya sp.]